MTPEFGGALRSAGGVAKRPVSALVNRKGKVCALFLGDGHDMGLSEFFKKRRRDKANHRLLRVRSDGRGLTENDKFTLIDERLEMTGVITEHKNGGPVRFEFACPSDSPDGFKTYRFADYRDVRVDSETALAEANSVLRRNVPCGGTDCVFLVGLVCGTQREAAASLEELKGLAVSAGKEIAGAVVRAVKPSAGNTVLGEKNLSDLLLVARHEGAGAIVFDTELRPSEISEIQSRTDIKVTDRTQLILEIFSSRASSGEARLQVKLAELRYALPRLAGSGIFMSNPGAGIGTRGPGEKSIERERRSLRKRIKDLERHIKGVSARRERTKTSRARGNSGMVSLVGYTNAGKSTLFTALTKARTDVADKMFSTLATKTRRLHRPGSSHLLLTDTVGFIKDLPGDLSIAFKATLEEISEAGLLMHIADAGDPLVEGKIDSVETIIASMGFGDIPKLLAFNKADTASPERRRNLSLVYPDAVFVSALKRENLTGLLERVDFMLGGKHNGYHDFISENAGASYGHHPDRQRVTL